MNHPIARGRLGLVFALASTLGLASGCAKDPTELVLTVTLDGTPARAITSMKVTLAAAGVTTSRSFAVAAEPPPDATVAAYGFPARILFLVSTDAIRGAVDVRVDASDPLTSAALLATGTAQAIVQDRKTTTATVALQVVTPADNGGAGGAGGAGGGTGAGGDASGGGAGVSGGTGASGAGGDASGGGAGGGASGAGGGGAGGA